MKISVVLCTYNGELYIQEQLDSIAKQSRKPDEVIICDDRSTDNTWAILEAYKKQAPFDIKIFLNDKNIGSTQNFAQGIQYANGDIIFLCDQDDVWMPNKIEHMTYVFETNEKIGMVFSDAYVTDQNLNHYPKSLWEYMGFDQRIQTLLQKGLLWSILGKYSYVTGATVAFSSRLKRYMQIFPDNWIHDEWITMIADLFTTVQFTTEKLILYRKHEHQQVGVIIKPKSNYIKRMKFYIFPDKGRRHYKRIVKRQEFLLNHISPYFDEMRDSSIYQELEKQMQHWKMRAELSSNIIKKGRQIFKEVAAGKYEKYSVSNRMGWKDFFD